MANIFSTKVRRKIYVLGKPLDQVPPFRQAGPALEDHLVALCRRHDAQSLGDVVILFDNRRAQTAIAEMFCRLEDGLLEIRMFKQLHALGVPLLASCEHS